MFFSGVVKASLPNMPYLFGIMKFLNHIQMVGSQNLVLGWVVLRFNTNHDAPVCGSRLFKVLTLESCCGALRLSVSEGLHTHSCFVDASTKEHAHERYSSCGTKFPV